MTDWTTPGTNAEGDRTWDAPTEVAGTPESPSGYPRAASPTGNQAMTEQQPGPDYASPSYAPAATVAPGAGQSPYDPNGAGQPAYATPGNPPYPTYPQDAPFGVGPSQQGAYGPAPTQQGAYGPTPTPPEGPYYGFTGAASDPYAQSAQQAWPQEAWPQEGGADYGWSPYAAGPSLPGPGGFFDGAASERDLARPLYGATFGQAVSRFFRSYATFTGRASRSEFWWVQLFMSLIQLVPTVLIFVGLATLAGANTDYPTSQQWSPLFVGLGLLILIELAMIVPILAITWRRLHDGNYPGTFYLFAFIPYVGGIVVLVFTLMKSVPAGRRFDLPRGYGV